MAGLAGFLNIKEQYIDKNELLAEMAKKLKHKSEDIEDYWINDTYSICRVHHGSVNSEKQPIYSEDKKLSIFMDGEIFDFEGIKHELIKKGHGFKFKNNGAELCLRLYEAFGYEALKRLNGCFLIAIYNIENKELIIANDRFASYNIYYHLSNKGNFYFSTQLSPLLRIPGLERKLDTSGIIEFFTYQRILADKTYLKNISVLKPGTLAIIRDGKLKTSQYFKPLYLNKDRSEKYYAEAVSSALINSVQNRTKDNKRYGLLLSGGLDARTILGACKERIVTFTISDYFNREVKIARKIAQTIGARHIFIERPFNHYSNILDKAVELGSGQYRYNHAHYIGLFEQMEREADVLLHGFGIDTFFKKLFYLPTKSIKIFNKIVFSYLKNIKNTNFTLNKNILDQTPLGIINYDIFSDKIKRIIPELLMKELDVFFKDAEKIGALDPYRKLDYFVYHSAFNMTGYLHMSHIRAYLNERSPIFDNELFDLHLEIPSKMRLNARLMKRVLRIISPQLAFIPYSNTSAIPVLPDFLENFISFGQKIADNIKKKNNTFKQSSWPNFNELLRKNKAMSENVFDLINNDRYFDPAIFNMDKIYKLVERHMNGTQNNEELILLLMTFGRWYERTFVIN